MNRDSIPLRYFKLILGLFLYAMSIVISINANLGSFPWEVFHLGLSNIFSVKLGTANIIIGLIIILIGTFKGKKPGMGTILNMILIGTFTNLIMDLDFLPKYSNIYIRVLTLGIAMLLLAFASYLYIGSAFGAGPRDGLMLLLYENTDKSIRFIRNSIEISVLIIGYILGGPVGIGTVILSLGTGYAVQFIFNILNFDTNNVEHRTWDDEMKMFKNLIVRN